jgi:hypothetical protein
MPVVAEFDQGWGPKFGLKKFEKDILHRFLAPVAHQRIVLVNSTWYNLDYHDMIMKSLCNIEFDLLVTVSLLDFAIVDPSWFKDIKQPVVAVGYYPGSGEIDSWALACHEYFSKSIYIDNQSIDTAFMCLNRKPHWHRMRLFNQLRDRGLIDQGIVTMGGQDGKALISLDENTQGSDMAPNPGAEQYGIVNDIFSLGGMTNWNRCLLNVVTETVWDIEKHYFVSEKIYKPIIGCRPFLVYTPNGGRDWLERNNFQCYLNDFNDITDLDLSNTDNIPEFLISLCAQGTKYYTKKIVDLEEKISYNKNRFSQYCREIQNKINQGITCPI